ncbi:MAG TPA: molybdopterin cofactor-binding domain-containing protein, partial [Xanthobacteraceae bacterium]|nr:molybdopterin cofactor-binding domain-containing protein [Xanthobacteraceae bacterium]
MTAPAKNLPKSLLDNPLLGSWIGFEETGRVRLATGKVEIGQGVLTALAQIAAEELDVTPARLRVVSGETPTSPREGFTSGSNSIAVAGASIRLVCAEVRTLFLRHVADRLACPVEALAIEDGRFMRAGRHVGQDYWSIARDIDLTRPAAADAAPKPPSSYRIVGQSLPRLDLADKVVGAAFIHDLAPDTLLHARMLRRPWPGARLTDLDETAVRRAAGAPIDIVHDGDLVAFTSDDELAVMRAAQSARGLAVWTGGARPSADAGEPDWIRSQRARDRIVETGTAAAPAGNRVVEATFSRPFLAYGSIGPSCALAQNKSGKLTVWTHSQGVFELRKWLAHALHIDPAQVTVLHRQGAGCYGHNSADDAAFDAAFVAMRTPSRTVRVQWTREDEFSAA